MDYLFLVVFAVFIANSTWAVLAVLAEAKKESRMSPEELVKYRKITGGAT